MQLLITALVVLTLGVLLVATEPRRLGNGVVLIAGLTLAGLGFVDLIAETESDPGHVVSALVLLAMLALLLLYAAVLVAGGIYYGIEVLRRERLSAATLLALVAGFGLLGYLTLGLAVASRNDPATVEPARQTRLG